MLRLVLGWLKYSALLMAATVGLYLLGQSSNWFEAIRFPFKILLMLLMIEASPIGAIVGWIVTRVVLLLVALSKK